MELEKTVRPNGIKFKSYGDILVIAGAMAPSVGIILGLLFWGLKLDDRVDDGKAERAAMAKQINSDYISLKARVQVLEERTNPGVLTVARSELDYHEKRISRLESFHLKE